MEYFKGFKNKKAFDARIEDLEYRGAALSDNDKLAMKMYDNGISEFDVKYWYVIYMMEVWPEVDIYGEYAKYIDDYNAMVLPTDLYKRQASTVMVARFYALAIHLGKLPPLEYKRKRKATLRYLAHALFISDNKLHREFVKASDELPCKIAGTYFEPIEKLMRHIP